MLLRNVNAFHINDYAFFRDIYGVTISMKNYLNHRCFCDNVKIQESNKTQLLLKFKNMAEFFNIVYKNVDNIIEVLKIPEVN